MKNTIKRWGVLFLCLALLGTMLPAPAMAAESGEAVPIEPIFASYTNTTQEPGSEQQASGEALGVDEVEYCDTIQAAGEVVRAQMADRQTCVTVGLKADYVDQSQLHEVMAVALAHTGVPTEGDYLRWQFQRWQGSITGYVIGQEYYLTLTYIFTYYSSAEQEAQVDAEVATLLAQLDVDASSDYEKVKAVYDWMCRHITYDYANLGDNDYLLKYTAYAALVNGTSVCQGYANLFYRLCLELGLDCRICFGQSLSNGKKGNHTWNLVRVDGKYYYVDATWGSALVDGEPNYQYLLKCESTLDTHELQVDPDYPELDANLTITAAEEDYVVPEGTSITWRLSDDGILTITGSGSIQPQVSYPWAAYAESIMQIVIGDGITSIPQNAFSGCVSLTSVDISATVESIMDGAFANCASLSEIIFLGNAPSFGSNKDCFEGVTAKAYYGKNETWTPDVMQNYGGNITWICTTHEHDYTDVITAPTCTEQGYTTHTCSGCGDSYVDSYTDVVDHSYGEWTVIQAATCTADGVKRKVCADCGHFVDDTIPAHGHSYESVVTAPTCTEDGYTTHTCALCGDSYVDSYTDVIDHSYGEWTVIQAAACTVDGVKRKVCANCGHFVDDTIPAHGHSYESVVTAPTCTEDGYTTHVCIDCGDSYVDGNVPAMGHDWMEAEDGSKTCSTCGAVEGGYRIALEAEFVGEADSVWIDGAEYPITREGDHYSVALEQTDATNLVVYTCNNPDAADVHTQYPTGMKVWILKFENDTYTAEYVAEFDNLLQYSGSSIRIAGVKGIRMITSIDKAKKAALTSTGLADYTLVEYGTALAWASDLEGGNPLTLGQPYTKSNYAYKKDEADPVFKTTADLIQYTNVLVGFNDDQCIPDIAMRPYIILEDADGNQVTIYGGIIYRSIGYIAYQNRNAFKPGSGSYEYVWSIIHHVYGDQYDAEYKG